MKKLFFLIFFVLLLGIVSAGEIDLLDNTYYSGETLQAYLNNYSSNPVSNIYILDNESNQYSIAPLVLEISDYFVYFTLPELDNGDYELVVVSDRVNFTVTNSSSVIGFTPGLFIIDEDTESVKVVVRNKGEEVTLSINSDNDAVVPRKTVYTLAEGESWNCYADLNEVDRSSSLTFTYGTDSFVVPLIKLNVEEVNETVDEPVNETIVIDPIVVDVDPIEFISDYATYVVPVERDLIYEDELILKNNLDEEIRVSVSMTGDLDQILEVRNVPESISAGEEYTLNLVLNKNKGALPKEYEGDLVVVYGEFSIGMPFKVDVFEAEAEDVLTPTNFSDYEPKEEESMDPVVFIGVVMIAILVVILAILYWKMKQKPKKDYSKVLSERTK